MASSNPQGPVNIIPQEQNSDTVESFRRQLCESFSKLSHSCVGNSKKKTKRSSDDCTSKESLDSTDNKNKQKQPSPEFDWNDNKYDFSHPKRGLAIIIDNEDFSKCDFLEYRLGSAKDAQALYNSFRLLGFDVQQCKNLEAWKMVVVVEAAAKYYDHEDSDCFACAVLTHGNEAVKNLEGNPSATEVHLDLLFGIDGKAITVNYLTETFNDKYCPALKGKPRLFFLQACRGKKCDDGQTIRVQKTEPMIPLYQGEEFDQAVKKKELDVNLQEAPLSSTDKPLQSLALDKRDTLEDVDDEDHDDTNPVDDSGCNPNQLAALHDRAKALWAPSKGPLPRPSPLDEDFLIMYATPPGYTAWRNEEGGSWFIQTLCRVLDGTDLTSTSLSRALIKVNRIIAQNFQSKNEESIHKKGMSVMQSKLCKEIFISKMTKE